MANRRRKRKSDAQDQDAVGPETGGSSDGDPIVNHPQAAASKAAAKTADSKTGRSKTGASKTDDATQLTSIDVASNDNGGGLPPLSRILSVVVLILGIIAVGALFYKVMVGFFVPLFLAALLVVIFRPIHEWISKRTGGRRRLAAMCTTLAVLMTVLLPIIFLISVATSQFTSMVSHLNFADLSQALDRARDQIGIGLPHAEQFRRLDQLADTLDEPDQPNSDRTHKEILQNINEAILLVTFLQNEVPGPGDADLAAAKAEETLKTLAGMVNDHVNKTADEVVDQLTAEEEFHRQSVIAAASIRTWMRTLLGGAFFSQVRLIANPSAEDFKGLLNRGRELLQPRFVTVTSATGNFLVQVLVGLVVLVIAVYFFLIDGPAMIHTLMRLSPLDDNYEERLLLEFDRTSRAVVLASVLSALAQGCLAAIAFWFLGFDSVILLFLLTSVMALVPFLGAASVWVPCAIYLATVEERWSAAIFLAIYGAGIVSSIDNVIKVYVLHGRSTIHPLLALLSVLGGVKVFGPIGILVGPMVVVFLQTLLEILNHELSEKNAAELTLDEEPSS